MLRYGGEKKLFGILTVAMGGINFGRKLEGEVSRDSIGNRESKVRRRIKLGK